MLLKLPLWNFFSSFYSKRYVAEGLFSDVNYWICAFVFIIAVVFGLFVTWGLIGSIYHAVDLRKSKRTTSSGRIIKKEYYDEANIDTGYIPEKFLVFVSDSPLNSPYPIEVDVDYYERHRVGDPVPLSTTIGGLSKKVLNVSLVN